MLAIKLQRIGKKGQPSYRVVVAEKKSKMAAPPVEDIGSYSTISKKFHVNKEKLAYWLKVGARPTNTVHNIFVKEGLIAGPKAKIKIKAKVSEAAPAETKAA